MKIVQINADYNRGSIGRTTYEIHNYLINNNIDSYVFSSEVSDESNNVFLVGSKIDHKFHGLMSRLTGLEGYFSVFPTLKLVKKLSSINPHVVHLRNLHAHYINFPILFRYLVKNNIPTVITLHDLWLITGHCCYYNHVNCNKWKSECNSCPALKYDQISWFFDTSRKCYNDKKSLLTSIKKLAVVGNSKWTKSQAEKSFLRNSYIISHIYNWIDQSMFYFRDSSGLKEEMHLNGKFIVLGVANGWTFRKGLNIFVELAKRLPDIQFILVGNQEEIMTLPSNIMSVGTTNNVEDLCKYYSMADVFINPSTQETFGKVTAEALSCGTPVIVNDATANPELVGPGCGYVVTNNNVGEIVEKINIIKGKGKSCFSKECVDFVGQNFNKDSIIKQYIDLYNEIARKS